MTGSASLIATNRDVAIMTMVYDYGGCTVEHIRRRFFPTHGARSACYARISKLVAAGCLASLRLPSASGVGSGPLFLTPGPAARPILAEAMGLSAAELRRVRMDAPGVIYHHLALCNSRLAFEQATDNSPLFQLREWNGDGQLVVRVKDPGDGSLIPLIPDASILLATPDGTEQLFLLEQDRGTVASKRLRPRIRGYLARPPELRTPVLWVVPDRLRQVSLHRWIVEEAQRLKADATLSWITTTANVTASAVLSEPIWQIADGPQRFALSMLAGTTPMPANSSALNDRIIAGGVTR